MSITRVKGTAVRGVLHYLKHNGGAIPEVLALLPAPSGTVFEAPILVTSWYPYEAYLDLLEAVVRYRGDGDLRRMPEVGRWLAKQDTGMFFKFVATFASMEMMARRCPLFWKTHCDQGTLECTRMDTKRRKAEAIIRGVPGMRPVHCELVSGWVAGMCEAAGASGMKVRQTQCVADGHPECRLEGAWTG